MCAPSTSSAAPGLTITAPPMLAPADKQVLRVTVSAPGWSPEIVTAHVTRWDRAVAVLGRKFMSPWYIAPIVWVPAPSDVVVMLVVPPESVGDPTRVQSAVKRTVPLGTPNTLGDVRATTAVNVTDWPKVDELAGFALKTVVVGSLLTVCGSGCAAVSLARYCVLPE